MPFHIADMALPPRAAVHEAISQDDPYHEDHHLQGDVILRKLGQDKRFMSQMSVPRRISVHADHSVIFIA